MQEIKRALCKTIVQWYIRWSDSKRSSIPNCFKISKTICMPMQNWKKKNNFQKSQQSVFMVMEDRSSCKKKKKKLRKYVNARVPWYIRMRNFGLPWSYTGELSVSLVLKKSPGAAKIRLLRLAVSCLLHLLLPLSASSVSPSVVGLLSSSLSKTIQASAGFPSLGNCGLRFPD